MSGIGIPVPVNARNTGVFSCLLIILAVILLVFFGINIRFPDDHAEKRHPGEPKRAEECLNNNGVMYAFLEPTGQIHLICAATDKEFYDTVMKDRGAPDGSFDGITVFRAENYRYQGVYYEFDSVHQFAHHLQVDKGWTQLSTAQFQGPFQLTLP